MKEVVVPLWNDEQQPDYYSLLLVKESINDLQKNLFALENRLTKQGIKVALLTR